MSIPGINTAIGVIARIVDTLWPTKKEALVDELNKLEFEYNKALVERRDTDASRIRKQMQFLRKRVKYASE